MLLFGNIVPDCDPLEDQLSVKSVIPENLKYAELDSPFKLSASYSSDAPEAKEPARKPPLNARFSLHLVQEQVSPWSQSYAKRVFDCVCVLLVLPLLIPMFLVVAVAIRFTSCGRFCFFKSALAATVGPSPF